MALETGSFIDDLVTTNPLSSDPAGQGDDHLRLIKSVLKASLPNIGGILGQARVLNSSQTISAVWNTSFVISGATVTLTTPAAASVTAGWYVDLYTTASGQITLQAQSGQSINGAASLVVPASSAGRLTTQNGNVWFATYAPALPGGSQSFTNLTVDGTMSVSGAATFKGAASFSAGVNVGGASSFSAAVNFASGVTISGAAVLSSTLSVAGNTNLQGATTISGNATLLGTLSVAADVVGSITFSGTAVMKSILLLPSGRITFPASQVTSSDANTLDDYEEGTFTPNLALATPGNSSIVYTTRFGQYTKIGDCVNIRLRIVTSTFSVGSTGAGQLGITGLPFTVSTNSTGLGGHIQGLFSDKDTNGNTITGSNVPAAVANLNSTDIVLLMGNQTTGNGSLYIHTIGIVGSVGPNVNKDIMLSGWYK